MCVIYLAGYILNKNIGLFLRSSIRWDASTKMLFFFYFLLILINLLSLSSCPASHFSTKFFLRTTFTPQFSCPQVYLPLCVLSALLGRAIMAVIPGFSRGDLTAVLELDGGVKKLICCLILKLPGLVGGPDPVRVVVNFNHG